MGNDETVDEDNEDGDFLKTSPIYNEPRQSAAELIKQFEELTSLDKQLSADADKSSETISTEKSNSSATKMSQNKLLGDNDCIEILDDNSNDSFTSDSISKSSNSKSSVIVDNSQQSLTEKKCDDINKVIGVMEKSVLKGKTIHVSKPKSDIDKNCDKTKTSPVGTKSKSDMITVIDSSDDEEITEMDIIELQSPKESSKDKPLKPGKSSKSSSISDKIDQIIDICD